MSGSRGGKQESVRPLTASSSGRLAAAGWLLSHLRRSRAAQIALALGIGLVFAGIFAASAVQDNAQRALLIAVAGISVLGIGGLYFAYRTLKLARRLSMESAELRDRLREGREELSSFQKVVSAANARQVSVISAAAQRNEALINQRVSELAGGQAGPADDASGILQRMAARIDLLEAAVSRKPDQAGHHNLEADVSALAKSVATASVSMSQRLAQIESMLAVRAPEAGKSVARTDEFSNAIARSGEHRNVVLADMQSQLHLIAAHLAQLELALASKASVQALAKIEVKTQSPPTHAPDLLQALTARVANIEGLQEQVASMLADLRKTDPEILSRLATHAAAIDERAGHVDARLALVESAIASHASAGALADLADRHALLAGLVASKEKAIAERLATLEHDLGAAKGGVSALQSAQADLVTAMAGRVEATRFADLSLEVKVLSGEQLKSSDAIGVLGQKVGQQDARVAEIDQRIAKHGTQVAEIGRKVAQQDERGAEIGKQVAQHDARVVEIGLQIVKHDARVVEMDLQIAKHDAQVAEIGQQVAQQDVRVAEIVPQIVQQDMRITALSPRVTQHDAQLAEIAVQMTSKADTVLLKTFEQDLHALAAGADTARKDIGDRLIALNHRFDRTEGVIGALKTAVLDIGKLSRDAAVSSSGSLDAIERRLAEQAERNAAFDKRLAGAQGHLATVDGRLAGAEARLSAVQAGMTTGAAEFDAQLKVLSGLVADKADCTALSAAEDSVQAMSVSLRALTTKHDELAALVEKTLADGERELQAIEDDAQATTAALTALESLHVASAQELAAVSRMVSQAAGKGDATAQVQAKAEATIAALEARLTSGLAEGAASLIAMRARMEATSATLADINDLLHAADRRMSTETDARTEMANAIADLQASLGSETLKRAEADSRIASTAKSQVEIGAGIKKLEGFVEAAKSRLAAAEDRLDVTARAQAEVGMKLQALDTAADQAREALQRLRAELEAASTRDVADIAQAAPAEPEAKEPEQKPPAAVAVALLGHASADEALIRLHERRKRIATIVSKS